MSLQSRSDGDNSPPMGEVNQPSKEHILHKLRDIRIANSACNRTAPVFLVQDVECWHWLTEAIFLEELLLYTQMRWFRPYKSHIDRDQFLTTDSQGHLSAVEATLDVAISFLMALEKREEANRPATRDVLQSKRVMEPGADYAARYMDKFGWNQEQMGPLMGASNEWVDATKRPRLSVEEHESLKECREMCDARREQDKTMMEEI